MHNRKLTSTAIGNHVHLISGFQVKNAFCSRKYIWVRQCEWFFARTEITVILDRKSHRAFEKLPAFMASFRALLGVTGFGTGSDRLHIQSG